MHCHFKQSEGSSAALFLFVESDAPIAPRITRKQAAGASLPLTREVDFCAAKRRRERKNIVRFRCRKNSFSPSVSLTLDSSLVRESRAESLPNLSF